jgi:glycosyltransferase A (GT-A) superfamily protein (DUF2064 family)
VLALTLQRAEQLGLRYHLLPLRADLDTPADYLAWRAAGQGSAT